MHNTASKYSNANLTSVVCLESGRVSAVTPGGIRHAAAAQLRIASRTSDGKCYLMPIDRIFLDLDGVMVDFVGAALKFHGRPELLETWPAGQREIHEVLGISRGSFWRKFDECDENFWETLPPYPWAREFFAALNRFAPVTILTSPSLNVSCPGGKIRWMNRHLTSGGQRYFRDYLIGPNKHLLARPGTVLVDDTEQKVDEFTRHGGTGILFPQIWNREHQIADPVAHVLARLEELVGSDQSAG